MPKAEHLPLAGVAMAIAVAATMDTAGLTMFSALPLLPLTLILWKMQGLDRGEMGLSWGRLSGYIPAVVAPIVAVSGLAMIPYLAGAVHMGQPDWDHITRNAILGSVFGIPGTLLTEERFFRGWLWGSLRRSGRHPFPTLLISSFLFMLWHISAVTLAGDFALPPLWIPVFLCNAFLLGMIWGALRLRTGSVVAPAACHSLWNGLVYPLFGFGSHQGALAVDPGWLYGPESGLAGLVTNILVLRILLGRGDTTSWWGAPRTSTA